MRSFGIVSPQFWTGSTGRSLRGCGPIAQLIAVYLMTSPHSHMCGLYYVPLQYIAYETGQSISAIKKALDVLKNESFAFYDEGTEFVWVKEMSHWQLGPIKDGDKRGKGIRDWYAGLPPNPFLSLFFDRYCVELAMVSRRDWSQKGRGLEGASAQAEGASGPIRSPLYPSLVPSPDLSQEGGPGETDENPLKPYGEFGHALLTDAQHAKLEASLGVNLEAYIARFDRWKEENKSDRKISKRTAYLTIPNWFERDGSGKANARASPVLSLEEREKIGRKELEAKGIRYT